MSVVSLYSRHGALTPSFDSKLPAEELSTLDDTNTQEKAKVIARKQNTVAMDALVQSMSDTDNFHCILQSMNMQLGLVERHGRHGRASRNTISQRTVLLQGT